MSDFFRLCRPADTLYGSRLLVGGRGDWGRGEGGWGEWGYLALLSCSLYVFSLYVYIYIYIHIMSKHIYIHIYNEQTSHIYIYLFASVYIDQLRTYGITF